MLENFHVINLTNLSNFPNFHDLIHRLSGYKLTSYENSLRIVRKVQKLIPARKIKLDMCVIGNMPQYNT